jgi:hypothetical protein
MKRTLVGLLAATALLAPADVVLGTTPANASGQIFAVVWLTNDTQTPFSIPFSGAYTPSAWGTQGNTLQNYNPGPGGWIAEPDGTPPRELMPGQTMLWGTKSDGGFAATSGTGGSLTFELPAEDQTATVNWSVPWSYFNGLPGGANASVSIPQPSGFAPSEPYMKGGSFSGCSGAGQPNTCVFGLSIKGGPDGPAFRPGVLRAGQSISVPTTCPASSCESALHSLTSADGSTTLGFEGGCNLGRQQQSGQILAFGDRITHTSWQESACDIIGAEMLPDGNFVAWNSYGDVVWQTGTHTPGAFLSVTASKVSVLVARLECQPVFIRGELRCDFHTVDMTLWSATAQPSPPVQ